MNIQDLIERSPIGRWRERHPLVPVVRLYGVIAPGSRPMQPSLSLASTATAIEQAFAVRGAKAVALAVNSPGGSPVQSALIHDRIRLLAAEKQIPVYVFCEDVAASGGYWIACAGDEIWANESSIVGSIGVISAGFGFEDLIRKLGIERRLHTSGEKKSMLDPFGPEKEADVKRLGALQKEIHDAFKAHVKARRGERLQAGDRKLFSGEFWTGAAAQKLGLVDGIGDMKTVLRRKFGDKVRLKLVGHRQPWLRRRLGLSGIAGGEVGGLGGLGGSFAGGLVASLEERAHWQRFGL